MEKSSDPKVHSEGEIEVSYPPVLNLPEVVEPATPTPSVQETAQPDVAYLPVQNAHPLVHEAEPMYPLVHDAEPDASVDTYLGTWPGHNTIDPLVLGTGPHPQWETPDVAHQPDPAQGSWRTVSQPNASNPPAQNPDPPMPRAIGFWELMEAAFVPIQVLPLDTDPDPNVPPERRWTREERLLLFHMV